MPPTEPKTTIVRPTVPEAQVIANLATRAEDPKEIAPGELILHVNPITGDASVVEADKFGEAPRGTTGKVRLETRDDFKKYVERHDNPESTTLWVNRAGALVAVLDDHEQSGPAWGHHRAECALQFTPEWKHWVERDGSWFEQMEFAEHIEAGLKEIIDPPAADMLEIAQSIEASSTAIFKRSERIDNGLVGIQYEEGQSASAGQSGRLEIPTEFTLQLAPFIGEDAVEMKARFRYRIKGTSLVLAYALDRPHEVIDKVIDSIRDDLRDSFQPEGSVPRVFVGTPRS